MTALVAGASPAGATSNTYHILGLASVSTTGLPAGGTTKESPGVSTGGRFIAFSSTATNLVPGDTNAKTDVFIRDTLAAATTRVSVTTSGAQANGNSDQPAISPDGRWVVFRSAATNLVVGDTNNKTDVFLHDMWKGTTVRASLANNGFGQANGDSSNPQVSSDGVRVLFTSTATNLTSNFGGESEVYLRNMFGTTETESVNTNGTVLSGNSGPGHMSPDARYIVFDSGTSDLPNDTNSSYDVILRDRTAHTTELVSVNTAGVVGNHYSQGGTVSDDGRYVAFESGATNMVATDGNGTASDIFVRDRTAHTTTMVDVSTAGDQAVKTSYHAHISGDGHYVVFGSDSNNLVPNVIESQVYRRDLVGHTTQLMSVSTAGTNANDFVLDDAISPDGTSVAFVSPADNLANQDAVGTSDLFYSGTQLLGPSSQPAAPLNGIDTDFLGRTPTIGEGLNFLANVQTGVTTPVATIVADAHAPYGQYRAPVMRLYFAFFKRIPDAGGLAYWTAQYQGGRSLASIADYFATSPEFKATYGSTSNTQFVTLVYQNVLGRSPDSTGLSYWVGQLGTGVHRGAMMVGFSESAEGRALRRPEIDTVLLYNGMLHRMPTSGEFSSAVLLLRGTSTVAPKASVVLAVQLFQSAEYATLHP